MPPFLKQVQDGAALGLLSLLAWPKAHEHFFCLAIFCLVFVGPGVLALQLWRLVIFLPRPQLTSWQSGQWQCVSLLSFYTFCFKMQDFLMVCLGFSKSLFTDPEGCQPHALKNAGQVYMCLKIHHHVQAYLMFWANFEADFDCCVFCPAVCQKSGCFLAKTSAPQASCTERTGLEIQTRMMSQMERMRITFLNYGLVYTLVVNSNHFFV